MDAKIVGAGMVLAGALALAGCSSGTSQPVVEQPSVQGKPQAEMQNGGGIADWVAGLSSGKKMRCDYKMGGEGDKALSVKMFADKDHYRMETATLAGTMISIADGKTMYTWTSGTKQGMKMDLECAKGLEGDLPKADSAGASPKTYDSPEQAIGNIPNISCAETSDSVDFSVPSDVTFADQCAMLKGTLEKMKAVQGQIPDGVKSMMK